MMGILVFTPANIGAKPYEELVPGQGPWRSTMPPPFVPNRDNNTKAKKDDQAKAGSRTPRKKSPDQLRKEWENATGKKWPTEPGSPSKNKLLIIKFP